MLPLLICSADSNSRLLVTWMLNMLNCAHINLTMVIRIAIKSVILSCYNLKHKDKNKILGLYIDLHRYYLNVNIYPYLQLHGFCLRIITHFPTTTWAGKLVIGELFAHFFFFFLLPISCMSMMGFWLQILSDGEEANSCLF